MGVSRAEDLVPSLTCEIHVGHENELDQLCKKVNFNDPQTWATTESIFGQLAGTNTRYPKYSLGGCKSP